MGERAYKIVKIISKLQKFKSKVETINQEELKIPLRPNKIAPPKPAYETKVYIYPDDENDYFQYDVLLNKDSSKPPVAIACFMGGHCKSSCIRRVADRFHKAGHSVYVLSCRGQLGNNMHKDQKKFREGYSPDDLNALLNVIPEKQVIVVGYSLGCFNAVHILHRNMSASHKVQKLILSFAEFDPMHTVQTSKMVQRALGTPLIKLIQHSKPYYLSHGWTEEELHKIETVHTTYQYDQTINCKFLKLKTVKEYYDQADITQLIEQLKVPTLIINTEDDDICGEFIPTIQIQNNHDNVSFCLINSGNHLGTVTKDGYDVVSRLSVDWIQSFE